MKSHSVDHATLDALVQKFGCTPQEARFDSHGHLSHLSLSGCGLRYVPEEIFQFLHLRELTLSCNRLTILPAEIGNLRDLQRLYLNHNRLDSLPPEIGRLTQLEYLRLHNNCLTSLPQEIGALINLRVLGLGNRGISFMPEHIRNQADWQQYTSNKNQLSQLPQELWKLENLEELDLWGNQLPTLPSEIGYLINLTKLDLGSNRITILPSTIGQLTKLRILLLHMHPLQQVPAELGELKSLEYLTLQLSADQPTSLPDEIWQLTQLRHLDIYLGQIEHLSPNIGKLTQLKTLFIGGKHLVSLPSELWHLSQLQQLAIYDSQLSQLPPQIGLLTNLQHLRLHRHRLSFLPPEIGQLSHLERLDLDGNRLRQLPPEIGHLSQLERLDLRWNRLCQLPPEIGNLKSLRELDVRGNRHLLTPPPEIVQRGTQDILAFLTELQTSSTTRYEAKLLVVGEGGTGKSSLLRALQGKHFDPLSETTHGIEITQLELPLPGSLQRLTLNAWDFGGQHIYHATHQFFLTRRSIYLLVWNARLGVEQGRIPYWLETIKALAPDAPVVLVATHTDERAPDINYQLLKKTYPQIVGQLHISNKTGAGLDTLQEMLVQQASALPQVGQPWPEKWLQVEQLLQNRPEHHLSAKTYIDCCVANQIEETMARGTLADYLHDLGKILYFRDDYILCNLVILKPNWITKAISLVLTDEAVSKAHGILHHSELSRIWAVDEEGQAYDPSLYPIFLRLMERFDLSYQIEADLPGEQATRSLVPQLLPYQPPVHLPDWPRTPPTGQTQIEMIYRFDFVPAGIMSWFIVRTHRYTQNLHWREGVLLTYQDHQARVELNTMKRELRLIVWGIQPHNFFTILMNTMNIILSRFQGLLVRREIPCICHWDQSRARPCTHMYSYEELVRRMEAKRSTVECSQTFREVAVPMLLYGIHTSTDQQVMIDIQAAQARIEQRLDELQKLDHILEKLHQQSELIVRNFARHWNLEMQKMESECPNIFILTLGKSHHFHPKNWISQEYLLHLMCQHPSGPHQVGEGYSLRETEEWWKQVSPWLNYVIKFLKFGVPLGRAIGALYDGVDTEHIKAHIDLLEEIAQHVPEVSSFDTLNDAIKDPHMNHEERVIGPALRALYGFLSKTDPGHIWGGLYKTLTPDGNILWLCKQHRQQYEVKPLQLAP